MSLTLWKNNFNLLLLGQAQFPCWEAGEHEHFCAGRCWGIQGFEHFPALCFVYPEWVLRGMREILVGRTGSLLLCNWGLLKARLESQGLLVGCEEWQLYPEPEHHSITSKLCFTAFFSAMVRILGWMWWFCVCVWGFNLSKYEIFHKVYWNSVFAPVVH